MAELFKSKTGILMAGVYLAAVIFCQIYIRLIDSSISPPLLLSMLLVAPWFYLFPEYVNKPLGINYMHEVAGSPNVDYRNIVDNVETVISVLINLVILYLVGLLFTKVFKYLSPKRP